MSRLERQQALAGMQHVDGDRSRCEIRQHLDQLAGRDGGGAVVLRGMEFGAAVLVLLFGTGLLLGYIAAERVTCF